MTEEKRKPGRPRIHDREPEEPEKKSDTVAVTYRPLEAGDPHVVEWDGLKFEANVAKEVSSKRGDMIAAAKTNPWFEVEGHPRAKRVTPTAPPVPPPGQEPDPVALDDRKMVEED